MILFRAFKGLHFRKVQTSYVLPLLEELDTFEFDKLIWDYFLLFKDMNLSKTQTFYMSPTKENQIVWQNWYEMVFSFKDSHLSRTKTSYISPLFEESNPHVIR